MTPEDVKAIHNIMEDVVALAIDTQSTLQYKYGIKRKDDIYKITITIKAKKV